MASNPYVNRVDYDGTTLIDLTTDTAVASDVAQGKYFHLATGERVQGTNSGGIDDGHVYQDANGYIVLDDETGKVYQTVSKSYTPTESQQSESITPGTGYDALAQVNVTVGAISSSYVGSGITRRSSSDLTASGATVSVPSGYYENAASKAVASGSATPAASISATGATVTAGTNTLTFSKSVSNTPQVSAGYISAGSSGNTSVSLTASVNTRSSSDLTASGATVTVPAGYYATIASKSVASGSVSASASKGTVTNHSVSVTPTASVTAGYISSGATGTAVTVSASELVSGTKSITANDTGIDVTNYASVDVAVPSVSPTLITKSITQNGTYNASSDNADGYSSVTVNVSGGGGGGDMSDPIRFFDYDGTLVASYSSVPASLPSVPTHDKLTNGTWNYTLQQVTTQFNAMGTCDVGANYETVSGATEIDIELQEGRLHPYLALAVNGTVTIDWGDNSTSTSTGTSLTSRKSDIHHEYAAAGSYTIKIIKTSGTGYSLYCTSTYTLLNKNSSTANANRVYSNCVQAVRVGNDCTIGSYAFNYCYSLTSVSIPNTVTSIGTYAFDNCYSLTSVSIPNTVTSIGTYAFSTCYSLLLVSIPSGITSISNSAFYYCNSLTSISIPSTVTSIGSSAFNYCYSLASVSIPSTVTSIGTYAFAYCYSLASVSIPSGVTSIGSNMFNYCYSLASAVIHSGVTSIAASSFANCYGMSEYHFKPTTPPTLANTNAFSNIQSDCIIYVPAASLDTYKTANNWSTYASYMVGE